MSVLKFFKSVQSFLTVASCILLVFGIGVIGNPVSKDGNHKSNLQFNSAHSSPDLPGQKTLNNPEKNPRFLTSLFNSDTMKCAPQVMCELISANEPGPETDTLNDYKYLVKEFFLRPDSQEENDDDNKQKSRNALKTTTKLSKKRKNTSDSSSEELSASLPSKEEKTNGLAQLMDLEEEEAIENKAIDDMVGQDPDDFVFALADSKKKHKLQELAAKRLNANIRFGRNVKMLEKTLAEIRRPSVFRTVRAIQSHILERKAKELGETEDMMDRLRIAAEVGSATRSGRQCRALFDTSSCSVNTQGIQGLVQNVRKVIAGDRNNNRKVEINMQDVKTLLKEAQQSWNNENVNAKSGPEVKVVLNIGGGGPSTQQQIQESAISSAGGYQPINYWPQFAQTPTTTITATPTTPLPTIFQTPPPTNTKKTNTRRHSDWPKLKIHKPTTPTNDKVIVKSEAKDQELRDEYKIKLQKAANLLRLPWGIPKNFTSNKRKSTLKSTSTTDKKTNGKFPKQKTFPKKSINSELSDSESFESSEEEDGDEDDQDLRNVVNILPMQNNVLQTHYPYPSTTGLVSPSQNFYRGLQLSNNEQFNQPRVIAAVPGSNAPQNYHRFKQRATSGPSLVANVYDAFFRKVVPLPRHSSEWIPSALRHGRRRSQVRVPYFKSYQRIDSLHHSRSVQQLPMSRLESGPKARPHRVASSEEISETHKVSPHSRSKNVVKKKRKTALKYRN